MATCDPVAEEGLKLLLQGKSHPIKQISGLPCTLQADLRGEWTTNLDWRALQRSATKPTLKPIHTKYKMLLQNVMKVVCGRLIISRRCKVIVPNDSQHPLTRLETHNLLRCLFDPYQATIRDNPGPCVSLVLLHFNCSTT